MASTPNTLKALIFDLDGTLLDFEGVSHVALGSALKILAGDDKEFTWELHSKIVGRRASGEEGWAKIILDHFNVKPEQVTPEHFYKEADILLKQEYGKLEPMLGALEIIAEYEKLGIPMAIATSSNTSAFLKKMEPFADSIMRKIKVFVCGDDPDVKQGKPAPDIFLLAAKKLRVADEDLKHTIVFEDSPFGVLGAKAAGMKCVALPDSRLFDEATKQAKFSTADKILGSFRDFTRELEQAILNP